MCDTHAKRLELIPFAFADECLHIAPGRKEGAARIYKTYLRWWNEKRGEKLSLSAFGRELGGIYPKAKDGTVWYLDVRLNAAWR